MTGRADYLELGDWNAVCFECGRKRKASMLVRHWQGYYVCPEHWEPRHPQDFVKNVADKQSVPWAQPMPQDLFVTNFCTLEGRSGLVGYATVGCCIVGFFPQGLELLPNFLACTPGGLSGIVAEAVTGCAHVDAPIDQPQPAVPGYIS